MGQMDMGEGKGWLGANVFTSRIEVNSNGGGDDSGEGSGRGKKHLMKWVTTFKRYQRDVLTVGSEP